MSLVTRLRSWFDRIPTAGLAALAVVGVAVLIASAVLLYRTYEYVEHDNQFCLSCHLMADPYDRFAQSAHRGLGCKACHKPTFAGRSRMALTQILEQPDVILEHAEVPNEKCTSCHVEGNPDEWQLISQSAGHRVHLESDDPTLQGLNCVECHSSSVHEFAATSKTCGQAGCHSESETNIQLGRMGRLTIHCVACHEFSRPVSDTLVGAQLADNALRPERDQCLSCHQMRQIVGDIPEDEPHDGVCGACHNPHVQATPAAAVQSCASAGCHTTPDTLTPMHRGLAPGVLENCTTCHEAHEFRIGEVSCLSCHQDIYEDDAGVVPRRTAGALPVGAGMHPDLFAALMHGNGATAPPALPRAAKSAAQQDTVRFTHADHRGVECTACHTSERTHGGLTVTGLRDCRSCHHTAPVVSRCTACHQARELTGTKRVAQTFDLSVRQGTQRRTLPFAHSEHQGLECVRCHRGGVELSASAVRCDACHGDHHTTTSSCIRCHAKPPDGAHPMDVHERGCAGSGCHSAEPMATTLTAVTRTRSICLSCHQELVDHFRGRECAVCHRLPAPRGGDQ
ncbi:MAG TPA: NapC/NirT family cytochrome c [Longimicrobiales bacterium]|nr:NapC/NirT family cytochrome c [Longimicrobiales bacterium]